MAPHWRSRRWFQNPVMSAAHHVSRVTKALNCRWVNPSTAQSVVKGKINLTDGMFEISYDTGVIVTTVGGPVTYLAESPKSGYLSQGLLVVMTPPISGRVATCISEYGPCIVAAPPISARDANARHESYSKVAAPPRRTAGPLFQIRTPALNITECGGGVLRHGGKRRDHNRTRLLRQSRFSNPAWQQRTESGAALEGGRLGVHGSESRRRPVGYFLHGKDCASIVGLAPAENDFPGPFPGRTKENNRPEADPRLLNSGCGECDTEDKCRPSGADKKRFVNPPVEVARAGNGLIQRWVFLDTGFSFLDTGFSKDAQRCYDKAD